MGLNCTGYSNLKVLIGQPLDYDEVFWVNTIPYTKEDFEEFGEEIRDEEVYTKTLLGSIIRDTFYSFEYEYSFYVGNNGYAVVWGECLAPIIGYKSLDALYDDSGTELALAIGGPDTVIGPEKCMLVYKELEDIRKNVLKATEKDLKYGISIGQFRHLYVQLKRAFKLGSQNGAVEFN